MEIARVGYLSMCWKHSIALHKEFYERRFVITS